MEDPKDKDEKAKQENQIDANPQPKPSEGSNWDEHQRIDEEGNELGPDDVK